MGSIDHSTLPENSLVRHKYMRHFGMWDSYLGNLLPVERLALVLFAASAVLAVLFGGLSGLIKLLIAAAFAILMFTLMLSSILGVSWAAEYRGTRKLRASFALPIALLACFLTAAPISHATLWLSAFQHLSRYQIQVESGAANEISVLPFREGIPDGGVAIIRSNGVRPDHLPQHQMVNLVGERIHWCDNLRQNWFVCGYD